MGLFLANIYLINSLQIISIKIKKSDIYNSRMYFLCSGYFFEQVIAF